MKSVVKSLSVTTEWESLTDSESQCVTQPVGAVPQCQWQRLAESARLDECATGEWLCARVTARPQPGLIRLAGLPLALGTVWAVPHCHTQAHSAAHTATLRPCGNAAMPARLPVALRGSATALALQCVRVCHWQWRRDGIAGLLRNFERQDVKFTSSLSD